MGVASVPLTACERARRRVLALSLSIALVVAPGCVVGSPLAAFSGEPYGMTLDDVASLQGRKGRIWSGAPAFAAIDLPFAAVLDTGLLPISLPIWAIRALASDGDEAGEEPSPKDEVPERQEGK